MLGGHRGVLLESSKYGLNGICTREGERTWLSSDYTELGEVSSSLKCWMVRILRGRWNL